MIELSDDTFEMSRFQAVYRSVDRTVATLTQRHNDLRRQLWLLERLGDRPALVILPSALADQPSLEFQCKEAQYSFL